MRERFGPTFLPPRASRSRAKLTYVLEVIEGLDPLRGTVVSVGDSARVIRATLEPQGVEIPFQRQGDRIDFTIDEFTCHQMVALHD